MYVLTAKRKAGDSYLMTGDEKSRPDKDARYGLSRRRHEENGLFRREHWDIRHPGGVGPTRRRGGWRCGGEANGRVVPQPPRHDEASRVKVTHLRGKAAMSQKGSRWWESHTVKDVSGRTHGDQFAQLRTEKSPPKSTGRQDWRTGCEEKDIWSPAAK